MTESARYRCTSCGNLTRFDVTIARRTREFHHYTVGGELHVDQEDVLEESIERIECRWCGPAGAVERIGLPALARSGELDGSELESPG